MYKAFTLAEVLLTLAIIGVIAALTIPAIVTKVQKNQYVVGLKKAYSTLKTVKAAAVQKHGHMSTWSWPAGYNELSTKEVFETYFKPHFDLLKDCQTTDEGCFPVQKTNLSGTAWNTNYGTNSNWYTFITSDGMCWAYAGSGDTAVSKGYFYVDVNGLSLPNIFGRDIFYFRVYSSDALGIKPYGLYDTIGTPVNNIRSNCYNEITSTYRVGQSCAAKVLLENAMNY